jgi:hypothetical protein
MEAKLWLKPERERVLGTKMTIKLEKKKVIATCCCLAFGL